MGKYNKEGISGNPFNLYAGFAIVEQKLAASERLLDDKDNKIQEANLQLLFKPDEIQAIRQHKTELHEINSKLTSARMEIVNDVLNIVDILETLELDEQGREIVQKAREKLKSFKTNSD